MDTTTRIQILEAGVRISHSVNTLGKGMNPTILPPVIGNNTDSSIFVFQLVLKENSELIPVKLYLKIHLVLYRQVLLKS